MMNKKQIKGMLFFCFLMGLPSSSKSQGGLFLPKNIKIEFFRVSPMEVPGFSDFKMTLIDGAPGISDMSIIVPKKKSVEQKKVLKSLEKFLRNSERSNLSSQGAELIDKLLNLLANSDPYRSKFQDSPLETNHEFKKILIERSYIDVKFHVEEFEEKIRANYGLK